MKNKTLYSLILLFFFSLSAYSQDQDAPTLNSFILAGRPVKLKTECKWDKNSNTVYCEEGQISWAELTTYEESLAFINNWFQTDKENMAIVQEEDIEVVFEDVPGEAYRVAYQETDKDYPLIVYYVALEVRGHYVGAVLSNYGFNKDDYGLSPFLAQFMNIPQLPENAAYASKIELRIEPINLWNIQLGIRKPIGQLGKSLSFAPYFGMYIALYRTNNSSFDWGCSLNFPVGTKPFNYYENAFPEEAKATFLLNTSFRYRRQIVLSPKSAFQYYGGIGLEILCTDLPTGEYTEEGGTIKHSIESPDIFVGMLFRTKYVGCFTEYHYTPYSIAGKVKNSFGNSWISVGITFTLL